MGIAGHDKGLDSGFGIVMDGFRDIVRRSDQRRAGAAAHQPDPGPQIGAHHQPVAAPSMQRLHPPLPGGIARALRLLHERDGVIVDATDQAVGFGPGGLFGFAHDHVQTDAKAHAAPFARGGFA